MRRDRRTETDISFHAQEAQNIAAIRCEALEKLELFQSTVVVFFLYGFILF